MKVPVKWLKEFVKTDLSAEEIARRMTMAGLEAENIERIGETWDNVYVGEVVSVDPHPNADRLTLPRVVAGEHEITVVTGAPNIAEGQKVVLALAGARLIDAYADEFKYRTLKPAAAIRGVESAGMVCSEKELACPTSTRILVLDDDAPVGAPLADYLVIRSSSSRSPKPRPRLLSRRDCPRAGRYPRSGCDRTSPADPVKPGAPG
ncbi:MAG: hypothetical protein R2849_23580 [Thermomicrobiales bacterium]